MSLQLYQVDQKSYLLDFKSLNTLDHPDADRVKRMTRASMNSPASEQLNGEIETLMPNAYNNIWSDQKLALI